MIKLAIDRTDDHSGAITDRFSLAPPSPLVHSPRYFVVNICTFKPNTVTLHSLYITLHNHPTVEVYFDVPYGNAHWYKNQP